MTKLFATLFTAMLFSSAAYSEEDVIPCGDVMMSRAFTEASLTLGEDQDIGKVEAFYGSNRIETQFHDIYCDQDKLVVSFSNGGRLVFDSYWGTWLPSPTGSVVQAFNGSLTMPGAEVVQARFWVSPSNSAVYGLQIETGFTLRTRWF